MPGLSGVLETCLYVEDLDRASRFYEEVLGLRRIEGDDRLRAFSVADRDVLLLFKIGASNRPASIAGQTIPPHDGRGPDHFALAIPAAELLAWEEHLAAHGVAIESRVRWARGGTSLYFRDPDGNLGELAVAVRRILNEAGLVDAKIMATGDLNEYKIQELMAARVPIDVFGVGTELATSADAPSLGVVYKLVELEEADALRYPVKLSHDKQTLPGAKQIFRHSDHDVLARASECIACGESGACQALQRPVMIGGQLVEALPAVAEARSHASESLSRLPATCLSLFAAESAWRVDISPELAALNESVSRGAAAV